MREEILALQFTTGYQACWLSAESNTDRDPSIVCSANIGSQSQSQLLPCLEALLRSHPDASLHGIER